jgi:tetratricopeptide (TPR) repeat protein
VTRPSLRAVAILIAALAGAALARPVLASRAHLAADTLRVAPREKARILHGWAEDGLTDASIEARQRALRDIAEAIRLDPLNADHWLTRARLQMLGGFDKEGRSSLDQAVLLAPTDPRLRIERGRAWKREWVRWLDTLSFDRALADFDTVTKLRPNGAEGWVALVPMRYEMGDLAGAAVAAEHALYGRPRLPQAEIAAAYIGYRLGDVERSDSLFRDAIPKLEPDLRRLFENAAPILGPKNGAPKPLKPRVASQGSIGGDDPPTVDPSAADTTLARTLNPDEWANLDFDPTTSVNETLLEFWSRVAHAFFIFWDPLQPVLDSRADLYIRYGPPRGVDVNPGGVANTFRANALSVANAGRASRARAVAEYPMGVVRWNYPELGMGVVLNDRSLHGRFEPPVSRDAMPGQSPDPAVLARRGDLMALDDGRAVFPTLPPANVRIDLAGVTADFEGEKGPRLFAQVLARGAPTDSLVSRWVVLDSTGHAVSRGGGRLTVSACDPGARQIAELSQSLPAGRYQLALSVRNRRNRGLYRAPFTIAPQTPGLALSDVVIACGDPTMVARSGSIRIDANVDGVVSGPGPLIAYFEAYRLAPGADGMGHFEIEYAVRRLSETVVNGKRRKEPALLNSTSREEATVGTMRRQFVTVPISTLAAGRYQLEIRVRDLTTGTQVERLVPFNRD